MRWSTDGSIVFSKLCGWLNFTSSGGGHHHHGKAALESHSTPDRRRSGQSGFSFLGIKFAPLSIPLERRLQTLGAINWTGSFLVMGFGGLFLCAYVLLFTRYYWLILLYFVWYIYDWQTPNRGSRRVPWFRRWTVWKWMRDYFPMRLIKTADLDPKKNYLFGCHPHGVMATGAFCHFATDATGFHDLYPGMRPILTALAGQFKFPFFREYFMTTGSASCSKESVRWLLTKFGTGNCVVLIIGGAREVLESRPGSFVLYLRKRKGFCKLALESGASLVPVFSFGENDLYDQVPNPPGSFVRRMQEFLMKFVGFAPAFFQGRGIFNYSIGLLPQRRSINTVVGQPIDVEKIESPSSEQVEQLHRTYVKALTELFETHKADYGIEEKQHLTLL